MKENPGMYKEIQEDLMEVQGDPQGFGGSRSDWGTMQENPGDSMETHREEKYSAKNSCDQPLGKN
jgi:hypothetical protein